MSKGIASGGSSPIDFSYVYLNVFTFVKDNILSGLGTITDLQINPENKYISISSTNSVNLYRLKLDSTLVKCYVAPALKNYSYSNSNFIDNQTLLVMGVFNTGPVVSNLFIYENFTNTTNRSPLIKG